jgi:hypothetical protein
MSFYKGFHCLSAETYFPQEEVSVSCKGLKPEGAFFPLQHFGAELVFL